jgi:hypothetical protein
LTLAAVSALHENHSDVPVSGECAVKDDHPLVRAAKHCLLCGDLKDPGTLVCWRCFRKHDLGNGNPEIEQRIDQAEKLGGTSWPFVRARG